MRNAKGWQGQELLLDVGDEVFWHDPDEEACSGVYVIQEFVSKDIVRLRNDAGSEVEAFVSELE
jgi:hypothetical protein